MGLAPGKGAHIVLNEAHLQFLNVAINDVMDQYSDEVHDADPKAVINALLEKGVPTLAWLEEKDKFGHKAYTSIPYKKGALRVTVVLTSQDELRLDIREWYDPNAS